jgi:hypothetical protein
MYEQRNGERHQREDGKTSKREQHKCGLDGRAPDPDGLKGHAAKINRFGAF